MWRQRTDEISHANMSAVALTCRLSLLFPPPTTTTCYLLPPHALHHHYTNITHPPGAADGSLRVWDMRKLPSSGTAASSAAADAAALRVFAFHRDAIMRVEWHATAPVSEFG